MNKPTTLTQLGEAEDELQHVFGVCNCPEGDQSCFYQREYTRIEKENPDLSDVYVDAKVQVAAYRYIKEHYADRGLLAQQMRELKKEVPSLEGYNVPTFDQMRQQAAAIGNNEAIDACLALLTNASKPERP